MILYNTLTKKKEKFVPIDGNNVKIYACGPTVYNFIHIGNARPLCVFDMLRRYLVYRGFKVTFVQNFTDIDDKIINKANDEEVKFSDISERYINEYIKDAKGLSLKKADVHPKATETIDEIISMIKTLVRKNFAYELDGDVYFDVKKFKEYGKLSGQSLEELESGARIELNEKKRNPLDFALWKSSKPKEPFWESPWGRGRPGWHIECSAMIKKHLGETIDIHCGGQDLIFPHHENEIAQSECANGASLAKFWLHNGFINVNNQKMSKSLNNFFTVREISEKYGYQPIRYLMISSHYKSPLNFSDESMINCKNALERLSNFRRNLEFIKKSSGDNGLISFDLLDEFKNRFVEYMDDDLNVSGALSVVFEMVKFINSKISENEKMNVKFVEKSISLFDEFMEIFGLKVDNFELNLPEKIKNLIEKRKIARENKNWNEADEIRDYLKKKGYLIEDGKFETNVIKVEC